jgi:hypothetical protein
MSTSIYLAIAVLGAYALKRALSPRLPAPLPPGPKGLPLLGNALDWPKERAWEVFTAWGETYGWWHHPGSSTSTLIDFD